MPYPLNNVATVDAYSPGTTLESPRGVRLNLTISNAAIFYQLGVNVDVHKADPQTVQQLLGGEVGNVIGGVIYGKEVFQLPQAIFMSRIVDSVRVRSGAVGVPARVTAVVWQAGEVQGF